MGQSVSHHLKNNNKYSTGNPMEKIGKIFLCTCLALFFVDECIAQKGGAKGAMRNRGRGGAGGRSRGRGGGEGAEDDEEAIERILERYDYSKPRPCVGLCFIKKLAGGGPYEYNSRPEERKPCVGMCYRNKKKGLRNVKRRKRGPRPEQAYHWSPQLPFYMMTEQHNDFVDQEKPCVGLCYITKLEKKNQKLDRDSKKMADKMANTN